MQRNLQSCVLVPHFVLGDCFKPFLVGCCLEEFLSQHIQSKLGLRTVAASTQENFQLVPLEYIPRDDEALTQCPFSQLNYAYRAVSMTVLGRSSRAVYNYEPMTYKGSRSMLTDPRLHYVTVA
jgi:hypothetical protein